MRRGLHLPTHRVAYVLTRLLARPIQGGAADLMTLAMLKLRNSKWLNDNAFTLLLQARKYEY